ncbi:MAG: amidohydrolase [Flavobacteriaceae bacterium]
MQADLIVTNGRVLTMDAGRPRAGAVAIANGGILAVGEAAEIAALAGGDARVIDAGGASVLPGFVESHMHLFPGSAELDNLHLDGVKGFDALATAIRDYAAANPGKPFLLGQGVDYTVLSKTERVTRAHLDRILPDRPFAMAAADHHTMWANTKALEKAGLLHGRAVGAGNEVVMCEDGLANGELREGEAFGPVIEAAGQARARLGLSTGGEPDPAPTPAERAADRETIRRGLRWAARHGITSMINMDGNRYQLELLSEIEAEGGLTARARVPFHFKNFMELSELERASEMTASFSGDWLNSGFVKFFMDGVLDSWTAVMVEPYADRANWRGEPLFTQEAFDAAAAEADRRGLQIAVHAIGDGAVRSVLDGYEAAARANGRRDSRHRIEHIEVVHPDDIARFEALGVVASMQPPHPPGIMDFPLEPTLSRIGAGRRPLAYAWRTLTQAGAAICFASDWPVADIDPLRGIQAAVRRKPWAAGEPDQSFTLHEAIHAYTAGGAYAEGTEDRKGRLMPGMMADLVVLDGDIEAVATDAIGALKPRWTICGGRVVFDAEEESGT